MCGHHWSPIGSSPFESNGNTINWMKTTGNGRRRLRSLFSTSTERNVQKCNTTNLQRSCMLSQNSHAPQWNEIRNSCYSFYSFLCYFIWLLMYRRRCSERRDNNGAFARWVLSIYPRLSRCRSNHHHHEA